MAETSTQNVTITVKGGVTITAIGHIGITTKREMIVGCITQRGGLILTVAASTQIGTLAPGATAGTHGDGTGGILDLGLIPAVVPLQ